MTTRRTAATVRGWAETILHQLGDPTFRSLEVEATEKLREEPLAPASGPAFVSWLRITEGEELEESTNTNGTVSEILVTLAFADGSSAGVWIEEFLSDAEAVVKLADQLQDSVLEATGGAPFPPCPGHGHPAVAKLIDGIASWTCPKGGSLSPIIPGAMG